MRWKTQRFAVHHHTARQPQLHVIKLQFRVIKPQLHMIKWSGGLAVAPHDQVERRLVPEGGLEPPTPRL